MSTFAPFHRNVARKNRRLDEPQVFSHIVSVSKRFLVIVVPCCDQNFRLDLNLKLKLQQTHPRTDKFGLVSRLRTFLRILTNRDPSGVLVRSGAINSYPEVVMQHPRQSDVPCLTKAYIRFFMHGEFGVPACLPLAYCTPGRSGSFVERAAADRLRFICAGDAHRRSPGTFQ